MIFTLSKSLDGTSLLITGDNTWDYFYMLNNCFPNKFAIGCADGYENCIWFV